MLVRLAVRIWTAGYVVAGIDTASLDTRQVILAIVVGRAFAFTGRHSRATSTVRITEHTSGALAHMTALCIYAIGTVTAGIVRAFVHVDTTVLGVTLKPSLAHAPRWIAWGAPRVDATRETIAGIYDKTDIYNTV